MDTISMFHIAFDIIATVVNLVLLVTTSNVAFLSHGRVRFSWRLLILSNFLLVADAIFYLNQGQTQTLLGISARGALYACYFLQIFILWLFLLPVAGFLFSDDRRKRILFTVVVTVLSWAEMILRLLNPWTQFYYSFTSEFVYEEGIHNRLSFVIPGILLLLLLLVLILYRDRISGTIQKGYVLIFLFLVIASAFQLRYTELSLMSPVTDLICVIAFITLLIDAQESMYEEKIHEIEQAMKILHKGDVS